MIINKTDMSIGCIQDAIEEAISFFLQIYPYQPVCSYEIILCDNFENLEREWRNYYGYNADNSLPLHYDGQFLAPEKTTDKLTILLSLKESAIVGAEQYFKEVRNGTEKPSEGRGLKLLAFFHFIELLCHEFSHLCSYDRMMGKKQIILIFDFYLKTSVCASEPLILLEEKLYFFCLAAVDDVHGSGKNEDSHLHHDRHPDMPGWKTAGSNGWDSRQRRNGRYLWQRLSACRK